jgi:RHS repeat-associated protein
MGFRKLPLFSTSCVFIACGGGPVPSSDDAGPNLGEPVVAPFGCEEPLDPSIPTPFFDAVKCLYEGEGALQEGVEEGAIDAERAAVLRGRIVDEEGEPIEGASVVVLGHPEWGRTQSRADGEYDIVVNGGGRLTVRIEKDGYLRSQRHIRSGWRSFSKFPDVVLAHPSPAAKRIDLGSLSSPTIARGSVSDDEDGRRSHAIVVTPDQEVKAILPDGTEKILDSMTFRATEFTVGEAGSQRMPADLPESSAYTYAVDLSLVEAEELGAERVEFSPPLINYVDNFLQFDAGTVVPVGFYDEERDVWEASESGVVIKLVGKDGVLAQVDIDGDGEADDEEELHALGIDEEEQRTLAVAYDEGDSLWRVSIGHFSTWDLNWPFGFPADALQAMVNALGFGPEDCRRTVRGSIIGCEDQTLGEVLQVTGTPYQMHYQSERVPGRRDRYSLDLTLSGDQLPESLKSIELEVKVLGEVFKSSHPPQANLKHLWTWNGEDAYGRVWQGSQPVEVRVGYVYDGSYEETDRFGRVGRGTPVSGDRSREEITSWASWVGTVGGFNNTGMGMGAWSLDVHHVLDRRGGQLHLGNGRTRSAKEMGPVVSTIAGTGRGGFEGDGGSAQAARIDGPHGAVIDSDGTVYVSDEHNHRIRRIRTDGTIDTYAGNGELGSEGDGGQATAAQLGEPLGLALAPDGTLYVAQRSEAVVRAIAPDGTISTFAGGGEPVDRLGDGLAATNGAFKEPHALAWASDGSLYIVDANAHQVRRVDPSGVLSTVVGTGSSGSDGDGGPAIEASLDTPLGVAVDDDGTLYVTEYSGHRIRRIDATGVISTLAGTGAQGVSGDGGRADQAEIDSPHDVQVGSDGSIYFTDEGNDRVRRVRLDGVIETVAGGGERDSSDPSGGDGGSPLSAYFAQPRVLYAHGDGSLWIGDYSDDKLRRIDPPFAGFARGETMVASSDGAELYVFDTFGRHQRTLNALTGFPLVTFEYDGAGGLVSVTDGFGRRTTITRDAGVATAITGPNGHKTDLAIDSRGYLTEVIDPAGVTTKLGYSDDGLLTSFEEASEVETHRFEYDANGLLVRDTSPSGYFQAFERSVGVDGYSVTRSHRGDRPEQHAVFPGSADDELRVFTDAAGLARTTRRSPGYQSTETPSLTNQEWIEGDPRFGMQSPLTVGQVFSPAPGYEVATTRERSVVLGDANNPLSIESLSEVLTVNDAEWSSTWQASDRRATVESPEGRTFFLETNVAGQVTLEQVGELLPREFSYDSEGHLVRVTVGDRALQFEYGSDGLVQSVVDPLGQRATFERDVVGNVLSKNFEDGTSVKMSRDPLRRLSSVTPPEGEAHRFVYSPGSLLSSYQPPDVAGSATVSFLYDEYEALPAVNDGSGEVRWGYEDQTGRLSSIEISEGASNLFYDPTTGQLSNVTNPDVVLGFSYAGSLPVGQTWSGVIDGSIAWSFDENLRISTEEVKGESVSYEYDDDGLLEKVGDLIVDRSASLGHVSETRLFDVDTEWTINEYGETTAQTVSHGIDQLYETVDTRDALGRLVQRTETILGGTIEQTFAYDLRGRVTRVEEGGVVVESYQYDPNGNRLSAVVHGASVDADYDAQDRLLRYGAAEYSQSAAGDLQRRSEDSEHTDFHYDRRGALRSVDLPDGRQLGYLMDGLGRRIAKTVDGSLVQGFLYRDHLSPAAELGPDGTTVSARFVYGTSPYVPDYMIKDGEIYRFVTDQVGSVRLVVNANDGTVAQRIDYTTFGEIKADTNPGFQPFAFAGGIHDVDTGFVRFGARDYDPSVGRWTAKDPILFSGGQANLYVYVGNNPVGFVDPSGLFTIHWGGSASIGSSLASIVATAFGYTLPTTAGGSAGRFIDVSSDGIRFGSYETVGFGLGLSGPFGHAGIGGEAGFAWSYEDFVGESTSVNAEFSKWGTTYNEGGMTNSIGIGPGGYIGSLHEVTTTSGWKIDSCGLGTFND